MACPMLCPGREKELQEFVNNRPAFVQKYFFTDERDLPLLRNGSTFNFAFVRNPYLRLASFYSEKLVKNRYKYTDMVQRISQGSR